MRVLVLGGGGQVASAVVRAAPADHQVVAKTHAQLDIGDRSAVARALREAGAQWLINAAAYTAVDLAEDQPAQAMAVNDTAVGVLATAAAMAGCRLLHLS
ncbi:MAG TPA: sugar nucleotide-binding protein, partial [Steroidobacteraceae bacterium]|nr:sugar nucleotide-binding protein [Steroidobacteraceae bacterium]